MRKSFSLFSIFILGILGLIIPLITLTAFKPLNQQIYNIEQQATGINETDFINTIQCFYAVVFLKIGLKQITLLTRH